MPPPSTPVIDLQGQAPSPSPPALTCEEQLEDEIIKWFKLSPEYTIKRLKLLESVPEGLLQIALEKLTTKRMIRYVSPSSYQLSVDSSGETTEFPIPTAQDRQAEVLAFLDEDITLPDFRVTDRMLASIAAFMARPFEEVEATIKEMMVGPSPQIAMRNGRDLIGTESFIIFVRLPTELRLEAFPGETTDPLIKKWLKGNLPDLIDNSASNPTLDELTGRIEAIAASTSTSIDGTKLINIKSYMVQEALDELVLSKTIVYTRKLWKPKFTKPSLPLKITPAKVYEGTRGSVMLQMGVIGLDGNNRHPSPQGTYAVGLK